MDQQPIQALNSTTNYWYTNIFDALMESYSMVSFSPSFCSRGWVLNLLPDLLNSMFCESFELYAELLKLYQSDARWCEKQLEQTYVLIQ